MIDIAILVCAVATFILALWLTANRKASRSDDILQQIAALEKGQDRAERMVREEMARLRDESGRQNQQSREELGQNFKNLGESLLINANQSAKLLKDQIESVSLVQAKQLESLTRGTEDSLKAIREELNKSLNSTSHAVLARMADLAKLQSEQLNHFTLQIKSLTESHEKRQETLRQTLEQQLDAMRRENAEKLEKMRETVDYKLQETLEKRLGASFKLVSEWLEAVHKGLGEMTKLADGVGDLKRVLTNVKARGTWGEVQLGRLIEETFTPDQYGTNVRTKHGSNEAVEYAIRLPGKADDEVVWLPIDSKFPIEDYHRLLDALEAGNREAIEASAKQLDARIRSEAKNIRDKYLDPPFTTDFAILFLPAEGLYAEVLRRPGLVEALQRDYRVTVAGPTTLTAMLNSLQMGFRTLAIEKRSSEVWKILGGVKTEFEKFGDVLAKVKKKLQEATHTVEQVDVRQRAMKRKLKDIERLPESEAVTALGLPQGDTSPETDEDETLEPA